MSDYNELFGTNNKLIEANRTLIRSNYMLIAALGIYMALYLTSNTIPRTNKVQPGYVRPGLSKIYTTRFDKLDDNKDPRTIFEYGGQKYLFKVKDGQPICVPYTLRVDSLEHRLNQDGPKWRDTSYLSRNNPDLRESNPNRVEHHAEGWLAGQ